MPSPESAGGPAGLRGTWPASLLAPLLLLCFWASGEGLFLRLLPSAVLLSLAVFLAASLRAPGSLVERVVRTAIPGAPGFIRGYCRGLTAFWALWFAGNAALTAWLAWARPESWWGYVSAGLAGQIATICVVEFFVRKTRFRYYFRNGPFDRLWSRLFPAEATERGRRSAEAIRRFRERSL